MFKQAVSEHRINFTEKKKLDKTSKTIKYFCFINTSHHFSSTLRYFKTNLFSPTQNYTLILTM